MNSVSTPRDARGRTTRLPQALAANLWKPGQSGNPSGYPAKYREVQQLCREASAESVKKIIYLRDHSKDDRVVYMCATWLHEQAWGKPTPYDPSKDKPPINFDIRDYTPEQLAIIETALGLIQGVREGKAREAEILPPEGR
jgi:hypothetical protein